MSTLDISDLEYDVFISYRREGGSVIAQLLKEKLDQEGYRVFLDVEELKTGRFDEQLLKVIGKTPNFVLILSPGSLDRCPNPNDWLTKEIAYAMTLKKNIVPMKMAGFSFSKDLVLPPAIAELPALNAIEYSHTYMKATILELKSRLLLSEGHGDSNKNFGLAGALDGAGNIHFKNLMPKWSSVYIFKIWPIVMALQWLVVIPITRLNNTWSQIDVSQFGLLPSAWNKLHPLASDNFFFNWNLLPFALIALLYRARTRIQLHVRTIYLLDEERGDGKWEGFAKRNNWWARLISNKLLISAAIAMSSYAYFIQVRKIKVFEATHEIYWWDWKISKLAYIVREVALFVDIIGLILLLIVVVAMIDVIWKMLRGASLTVDVNSGDRANGLGAIGSALTLFLPFFTVLGLNSVFATIAHRGQVAQQLAIDFLTLGGFILLYFILFVGPMIPVHRQVVAHIRAEIERTRWRRKSVEAKSRALLDMSQRLNFQQAELYQAMTKIGESLQVEERKLIRAFTWPIRRFTLVMVLVIGLIPAIVFVLIQLLTVPK